MAQQDDSREVFHAYATTARTLPAKIKGLEVGCPDFRCMRTFDRKRGLQAGLRFCPVCDDISTVSAVPQQPTTKKSLRKRMPLHEYFLQIDPSSFPLPPSLYLGRQPEHN